MHLTRLLYFSENTMIGERGSQLAGLQSILSASNRNNKMAGITGALVFDSNWFLQALEGPRERVWETMRRIEDDDRHANVVVIEAKPINSQLFGNWWMGLATRNAETAAVFAPYLKNGLIQPQEMTADDVLKLMVTLAQFGLSRKLAAAA